MTAPTLRFYPPASDNVREGLDAVLSGAYDVPGLDFPDGPPRVLDLGAHCGSFSVWITSRYPGARVFAYEPHPVSADFARRNTAGLGVEVCELAVVGADSPERVTLYEGLTNTGQRSIHQLGEQQPTGRLVDTMRARDLPPCDYFKADTEGCELAILREYPHLAGVRAIAVEWHSLADYRELLQWLPTLGFTLARDTAKGTMVADRNLLFVREVRHASDGAGLNLPGDDVVWRIPRASLAMLTELAPSYNLHALPDLSSPEVLDIGAHVGGFAWYALLRWPGARVTSYEAHPETAELLASNVAGLRVRAIRAAITYPVPASGTVRLYEGLHGRHECSTRDDVRWPHCSQDLARFVDVPAISAGDLPPCLVLKVDTEGAEVPILEGYRHLGSVRVLLAEAHPVGGNLGRAQERIRQLARAAGLTELGGHVLRFVRR